MKILVVSSTADSLCNFRGHLLDAMLAADAEVHVTAPDLGCDLSVRNALEMKGCITHELYMQRAGINPLTDVLTLINLFKLMRRIRPDVVLAYTIKPVVYGIFAAAMAGVPKRFPLITGLGYAFTGPVNGRRKWLRKIVCSLYAQALSNSSKIFFQNTDDLALFKELRLVPFDSQCVVVNGSGVDLAHYAVRPLPHGQVHFLLIARLLGDKGVREYVQAASLLRLRYPDVRFSLAGWIDQNPNSIKQEELSSWVRNGDIEFLGRLQDVRPAIAESSVFVLPSYREGTPRTVLEAMAMGRPIITTDAPGCRETATDGFNGFLVQTQSVFELACAMEKFINNPKLIESMGSNSRKLAEEKYDVHKVNAFMMHEMDLG